MVNKLKEKINHLIISTLSISLILILIFVNIINIINNNNETKEKLNELSSIISNKNLSNYELLTNEYYIITINKLGEITIINNTKNKYSEDTLSKIVNRIINTDKQAGTINNFSYKISKTNFQTSIILLDNTTNQTYTKNMIIYSVLIGIIGIFIILIIADKISTKTVEPVELAFQKQRQFISDASHELKTPLTVIKTNVDILKSDIEENKWLNYIDKEVLKMNNLIKELLNLTKIESKSTIMKNENLSEIVESAAMSFESIAFEKNINLNINIEKNTKLNCNKSEINSLITILLDNAIKHTDKNKTVTIDLKKDKNQIKIIVKNQGTPIPIEEREKIFERFYRIDKSRNREEERYGLGLSIAKSITEKHSGKIEIECIEGWTIFTVTF